MTDQHDHNSMHYLLRITADDGCEDIDIEVHDAVPRIGEQLNFGMRNRSPAERLLVTVTDIEHWIDDNPPRRLTVVITEIGDDPSSRALLHSFYDEDTLQAWLAPYFPLLQPDRPAAV
ncbi:hypothetical protein ACFWPX_30005 [Nocardia sp. NPDC058518]|uniref:hypothetical protein n=1 Tax=Nocardia sp. NPDC058518 TaxID=3346534 RepID=UPI0036637236